MATSIVVLDGGRLQQVGDPRTIYERPANLFVARFIGNPAMNVLSGEIEGGDDAGRMVRTSGGRLPVDGRWSDLSHGQPVKVGIRPEHLIISAQAIGDHGITTTVATAEWLGHEQILHLGSGDETIAVREADRGELIGSGTQLKVSAEAIDVHLFDPITGRRLPEVEA